MGRAPVVLIALLGVCVSCGSDGGTASTSEETCVNHYDCPAGQSCGTADGTAFVCAPSGPGKLGDACNANQGLPLQCGDRLVCLGIDDVGSCHYYCDAN